MNESIAATAQALVAKVPVLGLHLRDLAHEQLLAAQAHLASEGDARHKGIHQARKCIRRARAILGLGMRKLDPRAKRLDADLAQLCRGMSRLRDGQALIEALHRLDHDASDDVQAILPDMVAVAMRRRDDLLEKALLADPDLSRRRRRLQTMGERLLRLHWEALGDERVTRSILRSEHRVEKAERKARRHPDRDHDWHILRRRLRRLRQQDTVLAGFRPDLRTTKHHLESQADALGHSQDDALVVLHCGRTSPFAPEPRALLRRTAHARLRHARSN